MNKPLTEEELEDARRLIAEPPSNWGYAIADMKLHIGSLLAEVDRLRIDIAARDAALDASAARIAGLLAEVKIGKALRVRWAMCAKTLWAERDAARAKVADVERQRDARAEDDGVAPEEPKRHAVNTSAATKLTADERAMWDAIMGRTP